MPIKNVDLTKARFLMAGMSVGGLVSGLDTNSIIAQLTALEQMKVSRENQKKENAQKTLEKFKDLQTRLGNLSAKASALETQNKFNVFKSNSAYEDYVSISGRDGATAGQYEITVRQLATTQKVYSNKISAINIPLVDGEKIYKNGKTGQELIFGASDETSIFISATEATIKKDPNKKNGVEIKINKNDTLKDIVNKINSAEGAGVKASIMAMADGDNRLVLTAVDTGTKGFQMWDSSAETGTVGSILQYLGILSDVPDSQIVSSKNALLTTDGKAATEKNTFTDINTVMNKNNLVDGDVLGIYLPANNGSGTGGWVTFDLGVQDGLDDKGNVIKVARKIGDVLKDINDTLEASGANFKAKLNSSGEIVLEGDLNNDQNFNSSIDTTADNKTFLEQVKIQIGTFSGGEFTEVKKDMGGLTSRSSFANVINEGQNAIYTIDGMTVSSQSNSDDKTINGTVFTLKKATFDEDGKSLVPPIKTSLSLDKDSIIGNINAFVEEFNALIKFLDENMKTSIKEDTDKNTGRKTTSREIGPFAGDSGISALRDNLKRMMTSTIDEISGTKDNGYKTVYSSASRLGITTQRDGSLKVDTEQLTKAIETDFEGVRRLFTSNSFSDTVGFSVGNSKKQTQSGIYEVGYDAFGDLQVTRNGEVMKIKDVFDRKIITLENGLSIETPNLGNWKDENSDKVVKVSFVRGIANQIANFVENAKDAVSGYYKTSEKTYQARIDNIQKRVDELQVRVDNYNARITKQFAALERNMSNLQSQTANMMSALSGISYRPRN
ncbi:MAG: flagellar filament capping protein FliD [Fibromonadaceae bacterium]|nr:flagellar filament capping protein FliD [Fibromonadaceae bacterium]